jgi:hypothetical protein
MPSCTKTKFSNTASTACTQPSFTSYTRLFCSVGNNLGNHHHLCTDSVIVLQRLQGPTPDLPVALVIRQRVFRHREARKSVIVCCVRGHTGLPGNEAAKQAGLLGNLTLRQILGGNVRAFLHRALLYSWQHEGTRAVGNTGRAGGIVLRIHPGQDSSFRRILSRVDFLFCCFILFCFFPSPLLFYSAAFPLPLLYFYCPFLSFVIYFVAYFSVFLPSPPFLVCYAHYMLPYSFFILPFYCFSLPTMFLPSFLPTEGAGVVQSI